MTFGLTDVGPRRARPEPARNRVFETMTCVEAYGLTVRVWREEPSMQAALAKLDGDSEVRDMVMMHSFSPASILLNVGEMPRVAAIEILQATTKSGTLFYPDWR